MLQNILLTEARVVIKSRLSFLEDNIRDGIGLVEDYFVSRQGNNPNMVQLDRLRRSLRKSQLEREKLLTYMTLLHHTPLN